ncbi:MAG: diacylglycerol kinase [Clostridium sp.]|nr:diacylglycerol kinase [Clostridium sp.]
MKIKRLVESFNYAIEGIIHTVRTQRNMKIHLFVALIVLLLCFVIEISKFEFLILLVTISMVLSAEIINTAIESAIDMTTNHYHPLAKIAKNAAAGAVLITAINALIVGYFIFWDKISLISYDILYRIRQLSPYLVLIALIVVVISTLIVKAIFGEGTPLRGGMPSGHSSLAFSIATAISLITEKPVCIMLSYLIAIITAQSRVDSKSHSVFEVIVGGLFGTLLTLLIFIIFKI